MNNKMLFFKKAEINMLKINGIEGKQQRKYDFDSSKI
jgi:hypothetical protein